MKIKVCYIIGSLAYGGAEGQVLELIHRIDREQFEPWLVLETEKGIERLNGFRKYVRNLGVVPIGGRGMVPRGYHAARALGRLSSHLHEIRPDVVHAYLPACVIYAGVGRALKIFPPVIASRRSLVDCYRPNSRLGAVADKMATRASDFVLGNSRAIIEEVVKLDGVPESRTQVIYNGVDAQRFSPARRPEVRAQFGWNQDHLVFGIVANFTAYKRHLDFVRAASLIHGSMPQARFLLVGEDRGQMSAVRGAIAEAGLGPFTTIVPGTTTPELAFAAMDIYLCTSETEGFSNVLLEAMATGLPVISTHVGGNPEAVEEGVNGILVPAHAPETMARAALELARNPERLRRWSQNSRRKVEEAFSLEKMVQAHEDLYRRVVQQKPTPTWKRLVGRA
ncbi:MAG TPA: glycosyltransferase [Candidatus Angelobacter sp.]|jgi:glycosyltransferase involved in cell wall biosynthesis